METADSTSPAFMERVIILAILIALLITHLVVVQKVAFLGFYYLPVLLGGYFCGKRIALLISILTVFLVSLYSVVEPGKMSPDIAVEQAKVEKTSPNTAAGHEVRDRLSKGRFQLNFSLVAWGAFLVLAAVISSVLYEQKQKRVDELRRAYTGVVEILTKYLELANRATVGRSREVSQYAAATARQMKLPEETIENIRIAALLHDLGHRDISSLILEKSAELGKEANATVRTRSIRGEEIVRSVSAVLDGVAPIVDRYHEYFAAGEKPPARSPVTKGSEIIAVARAYYDMVTGSPTRKAWPPDEALAEIRKGKLFEADVMGAFERALGDIKASEERARMESGTADDRK